MKFLLIAFEGESYLIGQLAKRLLENGHEIHIFNVDHFSVTHMGDELPNYYRRCGLSESQFTNLDDVFTKTNVLEPTLDSEQVDLDFLCDFERDFLCNPITLHLSRDPLLWISSHHRSIYYHPSNKAILFKHVELALRQVKTMLVSFTPDVIFTVNNQYFYKSIFFEAAQRLAIPYWVLAESRVDNCCLLSDTFHLRIPDAQAERMKTLQAERVSCDDADRYLARYDCSDGDVAPYEGHKHILRSIDADMRRHRSLWHQIRALFRNVRYRLRQRMFVWKKYRGQFRRDYFLPAWRDVLALEFKATLRARQYWADERLTEKRIPDGPFAYFPLHLIPESSVLTLGNTTDELECVTQLAKTLPVGWRIAVKANPQMLTGMDTHPYSFYARMASIPNVVVMDPTTPSNELIRRCSTVASISGTALLEGLLQGKPGICWGTTEFFPLDGLFLFDAKRIPEIIERKSVGSDARYYVQSCYDCGIPLDMRTLTASGESQVESAEYQTQVKQICSKLLSVTTADLAKTAPISG